MTTTTIRATSGGNFTVPAQMRKMLGIEEGQTLEVKLYDNNRLVIKPIDLSYDEKRIGKSADKARKNIKTGKLKKFETAKEAVNHLHNL